MTDQWQELKETIIEMRDNNGTGTQQEVCKFLVNYMNVLEKQMQEFCDKAVSIQAVLAAMRNNYCDGGRDIDGDYVEGHYNKKLYDAIISLPPVNQQFKTGCWEKTTDEYSYWYRCSCCGGKIPKDFWGNNYFSPYCPECGAQMKSEEKI